MKKLIIIFMIFVPGFVLASPQSTKGSSPSKTAVEKADVSQSLFEQRNHLLLLDIVPTLTSAKRTGLGIDYQWKVMSNLSIGPFVSYRKHEQFLVVFTDLEFEQIIYGLDIRAYLRGFGEGAYLGASLLQTQVKAEGEVFGLFTGRASAQSNLLVQEGYMVQLGYLIEGKKHSFGDFYIDVAVNYGTPNSYHYTSSSIEAKGVTTADIEINEFRDSLGFFGALALRF